MRLSTFGLCEMRAHLVMALLNMDWYEEVYDVIKFWMITFRENDSKTLANMMNKLNPGQWLKMPNQDLKEMDLIFRLK